MTGFEATARAVYDGRLSFEEFAAQTRAKWDRLAYMIRRRWRQPGWVTQSDQVQDLLLGAWEAIWRWDERRTPRLEHYLVWNAVDRAKKRAHKARGASLHRGADGNPGRIERPLAHYGEDVEDELVGRLAEPPQQDLLEEWQEMVADAAPACESEAELAVVAALAAERSLAGGARRLYRDSELRLRCGIEDAAHAESVVATTAARIAARRAALDAAEGAAA